MAVIHIRYDDDEARHFGHRYVCGIDDLPEGDKHFFSGESCAWRLADCPGCNPNPERLGTPISELSGRSGGNAAWRRISSSWGYD